MDTDKRIFGLAAGWLLIISAVLALGGVFLGDVYSDNTWRFLGSLLIVAGGCVGVFMGLTGSKPVNRYLSFLVIPGSIILVLWSLALLWGDFDFGAVQLKTYFSLLLLTTGGAFINGLLAANFTQSKLGRSMRTTAVGTIALASLSGTLATWAEWETDWSWRYWTSLFIIMAATIVGSGILMDRAPKNGEAKTPAPSPEDPTPAFWDRVDAERGDLSRQAYLERLMDSKGD